MRIAYFDPYSGASGDMVLGALVDAGVSFDAIVSELAKLPIDGFILRDEVASQHGISGTRVKVDLNPGAPQPSRDWVGIRTMLETAGLPEGARRRALAIFSALAEAEGKVHGISAEQAHFHEVGAVDSILDITGAAIGLELLGVERIYSAPLRIGRGFARMRHGLMPLPAPATAELIARANAPVEPLDVEAELLTPTGAAILTTQAVFERPSMRVDVTGNGFGQRELPWPNALRLWVGTLDESASSPDLDGGPEELLIETNIDDMNPQFFEPLLERLYASGALEAWLTPVIMKRGRPATVVSLICPASARAGIEQVLIEHSTTLGIRALPIDRTKAERRFETVTTRWGEVRVKLKIWQGRVLDAVPEYADCLELARQADASIRLVHAEAARLAEIYVGQRAERLPESRGRRLRELGKES
ncbi:MAG TPA: nickel pincer cofactor biosynthesis protein LarC [Thermomicrobiaceae bacterium]|nr:nickel pincer cofactor biosynthesis protein LarC [Thermomicrobiaceae bacterium]